MAKIRFGDLTIEAGTKAIFRINFSNFADEIFDPGTGGYTTDTASTNLFNYHQDVYSIYNSYQWKLTNWTFKAGLRLENTTILSNYAVNNGALDQHYNNMIPAVSVQRNFKNSVGLTMGYTERIQRPGINQLNPFVDRSNPESIVTGNPTLRPVVNHIVELGFGKYGKSSFGASVNYAFSDNTIQNVISLISDTVSETTYLNVGQNQSAGMNLNMNYPLTNKLNINMNAQLSHLWITGTYNSLFYRNDGYQGNVNAFARHNFDHGFNLSLNYGYFSDNVYLQGKGSDYTYTSLAIIKEFLHKKAVLSFTAYSPFTKCGNYSSYTKTPDFEQSSYSQYYYRNFRLGFNYKFGRMNGSIKTNHRGIKNDDVPAGGNTENQ